MTCESVQIIEAISSDEKLLEKLYSFLQSDAINNTLLASFFSRTFSVLITRNGNQVYWKNDSELLRDDNDWFPCRTGTTISTHASRSLNFFHEQTLFKISWLILKYRLFRI
jgi:hypothetical protein